MRILLLFVFALIQSNAFADLGIFQDKLPESVELFEVNKEGGLLRRVGSLNDKGADGGQGSLQKSHPYIDLVSAYFER
jgi:hypothetical protein